MDWQAYRGYLGLDFYNGWLSVGEGHKKGTNSKEGLSKQKYTYWKDPSLECPQTGYTSS